MNKGRKLAEVVEKPWKRKEIRLFLTGASIYTFSVLTIVLIEVIQGNSKAIDSMLPAIAVIPAVITPSLVPRKHYIYEKGIQIGHRFVKWDEVVGYEWRNGLLEIKFKGIPKKLL